MKKFYLNKENKKIGGVCSGLSVLTGFDVTLIRVLVVLSAVALAKICDMAALILLIYLVVWLSASNKTEKKEEKKENNNFNANDSSLSYQIRENCNIKIKK